MIIIDDLGYPIWERMSKMRLLATIIVGLSVPMCAHAVEVPLVGAVSPLDFDPVPTHLQMTTDDKAQLRTEAIGMVAALGKSDPAKVHISDVSFWDKASGGSMVCVSVGDPGEAPAFIFAISIPKGPFEAVKGTEVVLLNDNQSFNDYHCNAPGAVHL